MAKELVKTICARRSIREYTSELVGENDIKTILETAMAAPSASNRARFGWSALARNMSLAGSRLSLCS
jgi:nitroreductase